MGLLVTGLDLPTARKSRNVGRSQNRSDLVGAFDCRADNDDVREGPGSRTFRGGAAWACGLSGKMPRRQQGMQQSMYLEISNQGRGVERWCARLHQGLSERVSTFPGRRPKGGQ